MVARRSGAPVLIVDLDGTLLRVNSYPRWARRLARGAFPHLSRPRRLAVAAGAIAVLAARRLRLIGHGHTKAHLQMLWRRATRGDHGESTAQLCDELMAFVRPELAPLVDAIAAGTVDAVLATAAAEDYAVGLARRLGFRHVVAEARVPRAARRDPPGERKRAALIMLLDRLGWRDRPLILFTDHPDDLPLMRCCSPVFWFGSAAHGDFCRGLLRKAAIYCPASEPFASLMRSLGAVPPATAAVRSRNIAS
jgi:phosphoserine phosphatase